VAVARWLSAIAFVRLRASKAQTARRESSMFTHDRSRVSQRRGDAPATPEEKSMTEGMNAPEFGHQGHDSAPVKPVSLTYFIC
jgi:hypothetical protein